MLVRTFVFLTIFVTVAMSAFGQVPGPGQDLVFFNAAVEHSGVAAGMVNMINNDEAFKNARSALSLSDVQVNALKALLTMRSQTLQQIMESANHTQGALADVSKRTNPNPADVGTAYLAAQGIHEKMRAADEKFRSDFTALLSADQRATLERLKAAAASISALSELGIMDSGGVHAFTMPFAGIGMEPGRMIHLENK